MDYKPTILSALETMRLGQLATKDSAARFKAIAYKKAMDAIRARPGPITSVDDVKGLDGVGKKVVEKVAEIIATGSLAAAERVKERTDVGAYELLLGVHGIGPAKARDLIASGITSIEGLRAAAAGNPKLLTTAQTLGLKYYESALERIPRAEMELHEELLLSALAWSLRGTVVGSYRRGAVNSGDIDLVLTWPTTVSAADAADGFGELLETIEISGYMKGALASGKTKWLGYVALPGKPVRRLDILLTPPEEHPYAVLYFTGSDKFNIAFRKHAITKGYTLNEHKLTPLRADVPAAPAMKAEADIFAFLGLKFIRPQDRVDGGQIVLL